MLDQDTPQTQERTREEESRLSARGLAIGAAASATAAVLTSTFWQQGTLLAAAATPVIVEVVRELLQRPTKRIAERITAERSPLPEAAGAGPPPPEPEAEAVAAPPAPGPPRSETVSVFRPRRLRPKLVALTAGLAFAIAAAAMTVPELIAGQSLGAADRQTTLFGGKERAESGAGDNEGVPAGSPAEGSPAPPDDTLPRQDPNDEGPAQPQSRPPEREDEPPPAVPDEQAPVPPQDGQ